MDGKKDKFLIARIPSSLKDKIINKAKSEGKTISRVVRDILTKFLGD